MSHIVKYTSPDGKADYHHTDDIHDAVSFVEQLRNDQGVDGAQIFRLEEVNFDYRPYYRVQLKAAEPMLAAAPTAAPAVAAAPEPVKDAPVKDAPVKDAPAAKEEPDLVSVPSTGSGAKDAVKDASKDVASKTNDTVGARRGLFGR